MNLLEYFKKRGKNKKSIYSNVCYESDDSFIIKENPCINLIVYKEDILDIGISYGFSTFFSHQIEEGSKRIDGLEGYFKERYNLEAVPSISVMIFTRKNKYKIPIYMEESNKRRAFYMAEDVYRKINQSISDWKNR